jgi:hypothetical protein
MRDNAFPLPRQHHYNTTTLAFGQLGNFEYRIDFVAPVLRDIPRRQTRTMTLTLSRIYPAESRLQDHGPEGAPEVLRHVFNIPIKHRLPQIRRALIRPHAVLQSEKFAALPATRNPYKATGSFQEVSPQ